MWYFLAIVFILIVWFYSEVHVRLLKRTNEELIAHNKQSARIVEELKISNQRSREIATALVVGNETSTKIQEALVKLSGHIMLANTNVARIANVFESVHKDWKEDMEKELG